jgi:hypothetical protein
MCGKTAREAKKKRSKGYCSIRDSNRPGCVPGNARWIGSQ